MACFSGIGRSATNAIGRSPLEMFELNHLAPAASRRGFRRNTLPIRLHSQLEGVPSRRNVAISLGLIAHKRDPTVPDYLDPSNDVLRLRAGESHCNRTLFDARDSVG